MEYDIEEEIAILKNEIATHHSIIIGEDDPIMMLVTANQRLIEMGKNAQKELLNGFKAEILLSTQQQQVQLNQHAENVLNAAIDASNKLVNQNIDKMTKIIDNLVSDKTVKQEEKRRKIDKKIICCIISSVIIGTLLNTALTLFISM